MAGLIHIEFGGASALVSCWSRMRGVPGALAIGALMASDKVTADMVEVTEFPHLGNRYNVMGVPRTVINEDTYIEGAVPESMLLEKLKAAAGLPSKSW